MNLQYGMNILASDMRNILERNDRLQNGVRTWRKLFGNASLANQAQMSALQNDYSEAITQAYKANLAQRNSILGAGLSAGSTKQMLDANRQNLHDAYRQYIQNYAQDVSAQAENYGQELSTIESALTERAKNLSNLYNSAYDYLSNRLSTATMSRDLIDKPLYDEDENFLGYEQETLDYLKENKMDWLRDAEGNLLSWNAISNQLLNPDGTLNAKGTEFFDKMFNAAPQGYLDDKGNRIESFDEWLSKENADLRSWAAGQDAYNFNLAGTNLGTAKINAGMESTDFSGTHHGHLSENDMISSDLLDANKSLSGAVDKLNNAQKNLETLRSNMADPGSIYYGEKKVSETTADLKTAWRDYQTQIDTTKSEFMTALKESLGGSLYNQFVESEINADKEYDELMKKMKKSMTYDEKLQEEMTAWYNNFVTRVQKYMRDNAKKPISGY